MILLFPVWKDSIAPALVSLMAHLRDARYVIIVDAARAGGVPETVYRWSGVDLAADEASLSPHGLGIVIAVPEAVERRRDPLQSTKPEVDATGSRPHADP